MRKESPSKRGRGDSAAAVQRASVEKSVLMVSTSSCTFMAVLSAVLQLDFSFTLIEDGLQSCPLSLCFNPALRKPVARGGSHSPAHTSSLLLLRAGLSSPGCRGGNRAANGQAGVDGMEQDSLARKGKLE